MRAHPALVVSLTLPDGRQVPGHYHVTEVGHVAKQFVDCGGTFRASEACVLQTWMNSPVDDDHRLTAGRLDKILELAKPILPSRDLPVEVEYEDGRVTQFPLTAVAVEGAALNLQLGSKHTDCLARAQCGGEEDAPTVVCCAPAGAGAPAGRGCCA